MYDDKSLCDVWIWSMDIPKCVLLYMRSSMLFLLPASDNSLDRYDGFEVVGLLLSSLVIVALIT